MRFFRFSNKTHRQVERYKSGAMRWITMPFHVIGSFFSSMGAMFVAWWNKRNIRYLLQGLPALFVFVGIVVVAANCIFQDQRLLASHYQEEAKKALQEAESDRMAKRDSTKPLALAQSYYNRLTELQSDNQENRYLLALSYLQRAMAADVKARETTEKLKTASNDAEKQDLQAALDKHRDDVVSMQSATLRMMSHLAPSDKRGYGRAHLWMMKYLYRFSMGPDGKPQPPSPKAILEAERHLLHALSSLDETVRVEAQLGLAQLYRDVGRVEEAKKYLAEVGLRRPEYRLLLAQWAKVQGENESVIAHAKAAENEFRGRLTTSSDDHGARFALVDCLVLQSRFADAQGLINEGFPLVGNSAELAQEYKRKNTSFLVAWYDAKANDPRSSVLDRLQLLERAISLNPDSPEIYSRLFALAKEKSPQSEKAREVLHSLVSGAKDSFLAHLFLGIDAWEQKNEKEARYHWEKALDLSPRAPVVLNNLAWVLAFTPPVDLNRALELAEAAVQKAPQAAQFRGTRGHIYLKLGRHKEALEDLQESAKAYPKDPNLFKALTECATKLGYTQMAENYKKEADRLSGMSGPGLSPTAPGEKKPDALNLDLKPPPATAPGENKGINPPTGDPKSKPPGK